MTLRNLCRGLSERPFPGAGPTHQMRLEDEFMQRHGGCGARSIYLAVEAFTRLMEMACRPVICLVRRTTSKKEIRRKRHEGIS